MCIRAQHSELTSWPCVADAREAAAMLPCGPGCEHDHLLAWRAADRTWCEFTGQSKAGRNGRIPARH
jgi:hypothetical protein